MQIQILKSKVHRATITEANLDYVGSLTLDGNLMDAAGMIENEKIQVVTGDFQPRPLLLAVTLAGVKR